MLPRTEIMGHTDQYSRSTTNTTDPCEPAVNGRPASGAVFDRGHLARGPPVFRTTGGSLAATFAAAPPAHAAAAFPPLGGRRRRLLARLPLPGDEPRDDRGPSR